MTADDILVCLQALGNEDRARVMQRYFKTGPGEYGEGDVFIGMAMPDLRKFARKYVVLPLPEVARLLNSPIHEARMLALLILCLKYGRGNEDLKEKIYRMYLDNTTRINNWDLVDLSAKDIVGAHLARSDRTVLYRLAASSSLWERRIAVMATFYFIRLGDFADTLEIARILLKDPEDLIHKAVGWMLREVGKRDQSAEERFLSEHCTEMPRTMLRYAVERFPEALRRRYM
jgi:3-methyladenine DNA glycosylase AlkD